MTPSATPTGRVVLAGDRDNGATITLAAGDTLVVRLHSTYWRLSPAADRAVLVLVSRGGTAVPPGSGRCVPGQGCGTVTASYRALAPGRTAVVAARTSCGEALLCTGGAGRFRLTVVVG